MIGLFQVIPRSPPALLDRAVFDEVGNRVDELSGQSPPLTPFAASVIEDL